VPSSGGRAVGRAIPYTVTNMVASLDGRASTGGVAGGIGGPVDREVMRVLRSRADAVLVGAASLRAEKMSLSTPEELLNDHEPQPLAVVLAGSAQVDLTNLVAHPRQEVLIASPGAVRVEAGSVPAGLITTMRLPDLASSAPRSAFDPRPLLEALRRQRGVEILLSEGGPSVNHSLIAHGLLREFFLTLAPRTLAGDADEAKPLLRGPSLHDGSRWVLKAIHVPLQAGAPQDMLLRYAVHE
jgi:riboflavin biosynthesis pyrimidine reductase